MTTPDVAGQTLQADAVRRFTAALKGPARHLFTADYQTIPLIRAAAEQGTDLEQLAALVGRGVGRYSDDDARRLMLFRIRRELGQQFDEESAATEGDWRA